MGCGDLSYHVQGDIIKAGGEHHEMPGSAGTDRFPMPHTCFQSLDCVARTCSKCGPSEQHHLWGVTIFICAHIHQIRGMAKCLWVSSRPLASGQGSTFEVSHIYICAVRYSRGEDSPHIEISLIFSSIFLFVPV